MKNHRSYEDTALEQRGSPRQRIQLDATLRVSLVHEFQTVVSDLSVAGFSAMVINPLPLGSACWLRLPGLEALKATVVWEKNAQCGFAFDQFLAPFVLDDVIARCTKDPMLEQKSRRYEAPTEHKPIDKTARSVL